MVGTAVAVGEDMVEGYHVYIGGGYGQDRQIGREIHRNVVAEDLPFVVERMLRAYLEHRESAGEPFNDFVRRHPTDVLKAWFEPSPLTPA
jgi:ferredoxin-nitrite reductase